MNAVKNYMMGSDIAFSEEFYDAIFSDYPISEDHVEDFLSLAEDFVESIERSKLKPYFTVFYHLYWLKHSSKSFLSRMNHLYLVTEKNNHKRLNSWFSSSGAVEDLNKHLNRESSAFNLLCDNVVHVQNCDEVVSQPSNSFEESFLDDSCDEDVDLEELLSRS
ncbi:hypothetical protein [Pseudoalteromonas luteoviolacea]|uniref:Uncharacterized protein n=1 Tax=Pseudoalteromonas luteoviolacea S4060-1 TaxID=1365257 RepID=A0A162BKB3_9GAMM|nr:hypothetical protein [Pseudoalteromonas luteoviolacea]KZN63366.1 hypothetical protein N478_03695 [Pseudoalteromonas luteoviolacea S4060-1]